MDAGDVGGDGRSALALATFGGIEVFFQRSGGLARTAIVEVAEAERVSMVDLDRDSASTSSSTGASP